MHKQLLIFLSVFWHPHSTVIAAAENQFDEPCSELMQLTEEACFTTSSDQTKTCERPANPTPTQKKTRKRKRQDGPTNIFNLELLDSKNLLPIAPEIPSKLYKIIQKGALRFCTSDPFNPRIAQSEEEVFSYLGRTGETKTFLTTYPEGKTLIKLIAFLITLASLELDEFFKIEYEKPYFCWCTCRSTEIRILWTVITVMNLAESIPLFTPESPFVYCSVGSGRLLQDFLFLAALIKLGIESIHGNFIDIAYETLATPPSFFEEEKKEAEKNYETSITEENRILCNSKHRELLTRESIFLLRTKLSFLSESVQKASTYHDYSKLDLTYWPNFSSYEQRLNHYKKRNPNLYKTFFMSDLACLVDPDIHDKQIFAELTTIFSTIQEKYLKPTGITSALIDKQNTITIYKKKDRTSIAFTTQI